MPGVNDNLAHTPNLAVPDRIPPSCAMTAYAIIIMMMMMHIYHALINALKAHMTHINLNEMFYTHIEHSPTKTFYIK